ncbi:site-specific integrase [Ferrovum sp.]|uniref:tyrosine-type recombinase/integrase n=1 Tax=Ferrovum sp. TaxID=2609467 RepID=UPI00261E78C0|nr:site-specific integrase [Ferrovum sp.]
MATYVKRGKTWRCQVTKKVGGEVVRRSGTFPTKAQAVAWGIETESEILGVKRAGLTGAVVARDQRVTVEALFRRYESEVTPSHRGAVRERTAIRKIMRDFQWMMVKAVCDVTPQDIARFREERLVQVSGGSVRREMALLGSILQTAYNEWGECPSNPARGVRRPPDRHHREVRIPPEAVAAFMDAFGMNPPVRPALKRQQVGLAFLIALETAARSGEILGLTWGRVHLDKRFVVLDQTKNGHSRHVPLSLEAVRLLKLAEGLDKDKVFTLTPSSSDAIFRRLRPLEWSHVHFHDARHEAVFRLSKKLGVMDLARVTGHQDLKMLMKYYNPTATEIADLL